ncbi:transglycosylase SLT domain-containing protein [Rhodanobacter terrae]|uniref:Transglycosylase SLT domain-containing protein n=1 Tax=Rhodanobacter terrae TaxID=418647 RepID=A0ABW0ST01_9GAMM
MRRHLRPLPLLLPFLLAACAGAPTRSPHQPAVEPPTTALAAPGIEVKPPIDKPSISPSTDVWDQLRGSFAMADCDADPSVQTWARRYTQNPKQFEERLQQALPRLTYVQQVAAQYDVAGEFVLLPWVESHFQSPPIRRRQPAGMWQIMPVTAGAMGLRVDGHYDGRLDIPAAAHAVMKLLKQYHDQFHDWRVVDYAYNAGEFSVRKIIQKHGMPADEPAIPKWPVRKVTREHLAKLLAVACVVREPARFNVSLPTLADEEHLVQVKIAHSMPLARAADHAGMSVDTLKNLNAAFRGNMIDADASSYLLLPASHVQQFSDSLLRQPPTADVGRDSSTSKAAVASSPAPTAQPKTHTVRRGDSLWQIARDYSVDMTQLQRWNHLNGNTLKLGQMLRVNGAAD